MTNCLPFSQPLCSSTPSPRCVDGTLLDFCAAFCLFSILCVEILGEGLLCQTQQKVKNTFTWCFTAVSGLPTANAVRILSSHGHPVLAPYLCVWPIVISTSSVLFIYTREQCKRKTFFSFLFSQCSVLSSWLAYTTNTTERLVRIA